MIQINLEKKDLWFFSAVILFLIGAGFVIAYSSIVPTTMGHSLNELERCAEGQILKVSGGNWVCSDAAGSTSGIVVGGGNIINGGCTSWGSASCNLGILNCPTDSTIRQTGYAKYADDSGAGGWIYNYNYICVKN